MARPFFVHFFGPKEKSPIGYSVAKIFITFALKKNTIGKEMKVSELTAMCKAGQSLEAYELAKKDLQTDSDNKWNRRGMGWVLYYIAKDETTSGDFAPLMNHIDELSDLHLDSINDDKLIFDNVQWTLANYVRTHMKPDDSDAPQKLSTIFSKIKDWTLLPSTGHSALLSAFVKFTDWSEMLDFIDWWGIKSFVVDDYNPFVLDNGKKMMTLVERAYIAYAKALLQTKDETRAALFRPTLGDMANAHPEMIYLGYYYGQLLLLSGNDQEKAMRTITKFVRLKSHDFWAWQLLSETQTDYEKQLACLLRAVSCTKMEDFLGKIRLKLAALYIRNGQQARAKHHILIVQKHYRAKGWKIPNDVQMWSQQPWFESVTPDSSAPIDYKTISNQLLNCDTLQAIGIVTFCAQSGLAIVYGMRQSTFIPAQKARNRGIKGSVGIVLQLNYTAEGLDGIDIVSAAPTTLPDGLDYIKKVEGKIKKRDDQAFAFLQTESHESLFVSPTIVQKNALTNGQTVHAIAAYDFNKKRGEWNWLVAKIQNTTEP